MIIVTFSKQKWILEKEFDGSVKLLKFVITEFSAK
jgi:hypothetical protein